MNIRSALLNRLTPALLTIASLAAVTSCEKDDETYLPLDDAPGIVDETDGNLFVAITDPTVLGAQLTNPYSLGVMRAAYDSLIANGALASRGADAGPQATHLYVRYAPQGLDDIQALSLDSSLLLFDAPLDYEVAVPGAGYRDPGPPDGTPGYLYCAVAVDYPVGSHGVDFAILDSLFQPEPNSGKGSGKGTGGGFDYDDYGLLERGAHVLAGLEPQSAPEKGHAAKDYRPSAMVRFRDDNGAMRGLEGVNLHFSYFTRTGQGFTDATGLVNSDKEFNYAANHKLVWERYNFAIKDGAMTRAVIDGPKTKSRWNLDITNATNINDRDWRRAMVHRGAYRYYYQDILGLRRPPENGVLKFQLHYRVSDEIDPESLGRHCPACQWLGFGSQIKIYVRASRPTAENYIATTIHETAHASHWQLYEGDLNWSNVHVRVKEGWARGVQRYLTATMYPNYKPDYFGEYSGLVEDLNDSGDGRTQDYIGSSPSNPNQPIRISGATNVDYVTGYVLPQLENSLTQASSYDEWRDAIVSDHVNSTESHVPSLFTFWNL